MMNAKIFFIGLMLLTAFGCQKQAVSNQSNGAGPSVPANNSAVNANAANQPKPDAKLVAPQTVKFESAGKAEIVGTFYGSASPNSPAVLLLHQWQSDRKSFDEFATRMQRKGFAVLAIDGRGFGESTKTADGKTVPAARDAETVKAMKADVDGAFQFLGKQPNVDPTKIGIVGASYGSSLALIYAAENKAVKTVALLSPGLNYFGNLPTEPAAKSYGKRPLLMVAAQDDKESAEAVKKLMTTGDAEKYEMQIYGAGGHGTDIFKAKLGLDDFLEKFLTRTLE